MVSGQMTKYQINLDLVKIIQFCLKTKYQINLDLVKIIQFMICRDTPTHGWVCGWVSGSIGGVRSND